MIAQRRSVTDDADLPLALPLLVDLEHLQRGSLRLFVGVVRSRVAHHSRLGKIKPRLTGRGVERRKHDAHVGSGERRQAGHRHAREILRLTAADLDHGIAQVTSVEQGVPGKIEVSVDDHAHRACPGAIGRVIRDGRDSS